MFNNKIFNPYIQLFFMLLSVGLIILQLFVKNYNMIDLESVYYDFYDTPRIDSRMLFNISIDGCNIKGVYEGDSFREVKSSGSNTEDKCKNYNYSVGDDPNASVNRLIGNNFGYENSN